VVSPADRELVIELMCRARAAQRLLADALTAQSIEPRVAVWGAHAQLAALLRLLADRVGVAEEV
jgi:hypothetical protein